MAPPRHRVVLVREEGSEPYGTQVRSPEDAGAIARGLLGEEATEVALVFFLNRRHRIVGYMEVGRGGVAHSPMEPREILQAALLANAAAIIVAHNHPSGETSPSADDLAITRRLFRACEIVGLEMVDHVIVGDDLYSFSKHGALDGGAMR